MISKCTILTKMDQVSVMMSNIRQIQILKSDQDLKVCMHSGARYGE
jgi:hypothetical protein